MPEFNEPKTLETVTVTGFIKKHKKPLVFVALAVIVLVAIYYATKQKPV